MGTLQHRCASGDVTMTSSAGGATLFRARCLSVLTNVWAMWSGTNNHSASLGTSSESLFNFVINNVASILSWDSMAALAALPFATEIVPEYKAHMTVACKAAPVRAADAASHSACPQQNEIIDLSSISNKVGARFQTRPVRFSFSFHSWTQLH